MERELETLLARHQTSPELRAEIAALLRRATESSAALIGSTVDVEGVPNAEDPALEPAEPWDLGLLGKGGMGEVRRVWDPRLERVVACKVLRDERAKQPGAVARFVAEARVTASLSHPGVPPVYALGRLADGRPHFTMREVRGRTLDIVIRELHAASTSEGWGTTSDGWNLRGLVGAWRKLCETMAYAHAQGVVHRDLKPANVMIGDYGEVLVVDWGLALREGQARVAGGDAAGGGHVAGTPAYMAPEQARGDSGALVRLADVYALGAILYEILSGHAPYAEVPAADVLAHVLAGPPTAPGRVTGPLGPRPTSWSRDDTPGPPLPSSLVALCEWAMHRDPEERPRDAAALLAEVVAWSEGLRSRDQALGLLAGAAAFSSDARRWRGDARDRLTDAAGRRAALLPEAPDSEKLPMWELEDEAARLLRHADLLDAQAEEKLTRAAALAPDVPEVHVALAERCREMCEAAEAIGATPPGLEFRLRTHVAALPEAHPARARHLAWLRGDGALTIVTEPAGAEVWLYRYQQEGRRLAATHYRDLGATPLVEVRLGRGSWLIVLRHPDCAEVRYPVQIGRLEHWDGVRPGGSEPHPIALPRAGTLGEDEIYVPAGWFRSGGDRGALAPLPERRLWLDAFVMSRDLAKVPGGDEPITGVSWAEARDHAEAVARSSGLPWRLPWQLEWEKAARGVDGRAWTWGNHFEPSLSRSPGDESAYGVRDLGGAISEWCADDHRPHGPTVVDHRPALEADADAEFRVVRGGSLRSGGIVERCASRMWWPAVQRSPALGFRLARAF